MKQLNEFILLFRYEPSNEEPTKEQMQQMQKLWGEFIGGIAMQGNLVNTYQLGFEGNKVLSDLSSQEGFHISDNQIIGGNMVLKAESIESVTELAKNCPILKIGGTVEIRDIIPMD